MQQRPEQLEMRISRINTYLLIQRPEQLEMRISRIDTYLLILARD